MVEDQQNKNQANKDQVVGQHVEAMLNSAPQAVQPEPPAPPPLPPTPASETFTPNNPEAQIVDMAEPFKHKKNEPPIKVGKSKHFWRKLWRKPLYRYLTIIAVFAMLVGIFAIPNSRYFILNTLGARSSASLTVLDNSTQLPLKNVNVSLAGQQAKTDEVGRVTFHHIKLGNTKLSLQKRAFANTNKNITIGWGSNPLGSFKVDPTGSQYSIFVKDWLTGRDLAGASAHSGDADANSDQNGKILLTIDPTMAQADTLDVKIHADKYRDLTLRLELESKSDRFANMVIARKDVFITNQSGKFDVYSIDIDGKNKKLVLAGSGLEKDDIVLVQHPTHEVAALVSSRVNARNNDDYLLNTLTLINLEDNTTRAIAQSEQVQLVGWITNRLIYVQIQAGASAANNKRFRLMSYDFKTGNKKELAAANSFNDVMLDGGFVYYAPASAYQKDPAAGLKRSNADGSSQKIILKEEVWNIFRVAYSKLNLATEKHWYEFTIGSTDEPSRISAPSNPKNRLYISSLDNKHSLWIDQRDGKGLLIDHNIQENVDNNLVSKKGLIYPVKWLNNEVFIYRVENDDETADYVMDINGGKSYKVTDLYNAKGIDRWYYY